MAEPDHMDEATHPLSPHDLQIDAIIANLVRYYALPEAFNPDESASTPSLDGGQEISASSTKVKTELTPNAVRLKDDPTLVALAQLGTLHCHTQRSFISLVDSKSQYILAEATPSVSLQDSSKCQPGENIALGAAKLGLSFGACPLAIRTFTGSQTDPAASHHLLPDEQDVYFIGDMTEVDEYKTRPAIASWPYLRFYAGVPLRTQDGQVIGMYSVTDSRARMSMTGDEIEKMRDIASVIVDHLQLVQIQDRLERSHNMIKGLGRFVDGKTVKHLWQDAFDNQLQNLPEQTQASPELDAGFATTISTQSPFSMISTADTATSNFFRDISDTLSELKDEGRIGVPTSGSPTDVVGSVHKNQQEGPGYFTIEDTTSSMFGSGLETHSAESESPMLPEENKEFAIKTLFSRASHWVRQAADFDGVLFLDAEMQETKAKRRQGRKTANVTVQTRLSSTNQSNEGRSCDILGFSLESRARSGASFPSTLQVEIPQSTLNGLLQKYPHGRVFQFDEYGKLLQTITTDNETHKAGKASFKSQKEQAKFEKEKDLLEAYQLLEICHYPRSIAFFPLWDPHRDQWYAGSLAWSLDPIRVLQHEELMFLGAFGSCVMAEKSKIDMLNADREKSNFISSVSHELRTPMHGILASIDSLADSASHIAQDEIRTIIICGDVLMDTMDHILDYSKNVRNDQKLITPGGRHKAWQGTTSHADSYDFSKLVENVVEGTHAGFSFRTNINPQEKASQLEMYRATRVTPPSTNPQVMVILEIEHQFSWLYESQIGAWKRIITNAFGNALKYTQAGFIRISLRSEASESELEGTIILEIEDSGIGMTKEFLKHGLYIPFVQANPLSVGTGLGLSIVRQLVDDLQGTIDIQSEVDYGTRMTIKAPLKHTLSEMLDLTAAGTNDSVRDIAVWCKGLSICLIGFDYYPDIDEVPTGILNVHGRRMLYIRSSISVCANNWFGLETKHCRTFAEAEGDIFITPFSQINLSEWHSQRPLIVFEDFRSGNGPSTEDGRYYLSQPFGPHKFGRILGSCLEYRSAIPELDRSSTLACSPSVSVMTPSELANSAPNPTSSLVAGLTHVSLERPRYSRSPLAVHSNSKAVNPQEIPYGTGHVVAAISKPQDRSVVLLILVNLMKKAKARHQSATNGLEAVHQYMAAPSSIKVIFMDISMPIKDGIQATKEIRQFELANSLARVRIVAVTCFSSAEVQRDAFQSGVDMFTLKPVPMKALKPILEMDPNDVVPP